MYGIIHYREKEAAQSIVGSLSDSSCFVLARWGCDPAGFFVFIRWATAETVI